MVSLGSNINDLYVMSKLGDIMLLFWEIYVYYNRVGLGR